MMPFRCTLCGEWHSDEDWSVRYRPCIKNCAVCGRALGQRLWYNTRGPLCDRCFDSISHLYDGTRS